MNAAAAPVYNFHELSDDVLLTEAQAAAMLGYARRTLANARCKRRPVVAFIKLNGAVRYRVGAIRAALTDTSNQNN